MIKNVAENLSRLERISQNNKIISNQISFKQENEDKFIHATSSNPFDNTSSCENEYQDYFNEKYKDITNFAKEIQFRLQKGDIKQEIENSLIEFHGVISKYKLDGTLPNNGKKYSIKQKNGIKKLSVLSQDDEPLYEVDFKKGEILKITSFKDGYTTSILFKNQSLFDRLFNSNKTTLKQYNKKDKDGNLVEEVIFNKRNIPEKYIEYSKNEKRVLVFDNSDYTSSIDKLLPLKYSHYKNGNKVQNLDFTYSKPSKFEEFSENTGKITKMFRLQGLKSQVYKYAFYNSLNGNLIASGSI